MSHCELVSERLKRWNEGEVDVLFASSTRQAATSSLASNIWLLNVHKILGTAKLCLPCFLSGPAQ